MSRKRLFIGEAAWGIHEQDVEETIAAVREAMENEIVVQLALLDGADRNVTMLFNGRGASNVVFDLDIGPRPSEIAG
jgi:hypothetical protein